MLQALIVLELQCCLFGFVVHGQFRFLASGQMASWFFWWMMREQVGKSWERLANDRSCLRKGTRTRTERIRSGDERELNENGLFSESVILCATRHSLPIHSLRDICYLQSIAERRSYEQRSRIVNECMNGVHLFCYERERERRSKILWTMKWMAVHITTVLSKKCIWFV